MKAIVVIGANYGDEGKGLTIDYLARQQVAKGFAPLIVRFNGGAQAGHTVVTDDGQSHIFHHVGAGQFNAGARTYLSSPFIVNPYALRKELVMFKEPPLLYVHPNCQVTTIFDMAINSIAELSRGAQRHGSCGMGVNETVTRTAGGFPLRVSNVAKLTVDALALVLRDIVEKWVPQRLEALGLSKDDLDQHELYATVLSASTSFIRQAEYLKELIEPLTILDKPLLDGLIASIQPGQEVLFEGAQGLALDEFLGTFPYVTRSVCGLPSALAVGAFELGVTEFEPLYITRAYLTRHGAGPLPLEGELITNKPLHDTTNIENMWQGALRRAPLNIPQLKTLIEADIARVQRAPAVLNKGATLTRARLMLTCLDQLGDEVCIVTAAGLTKLPPADLPITLARELGRDITVSYCSYGPTAAHVKSWI